MPGQLVLCTLLAPLPSEISPPVPDSAAMSTVASSEAGSPIITSPAHSRTPVQKRALDYLLNVLRNGAGDDASSPRQIEVPSYPVELRVNICALLGQLGKRTSGNELETLKDNARPTLEDLSRLSVNTGKENMLTTAAKKALDLWT